MVWTLVKNVLGVGTAIAEGWQERKKVKLENDLAISKASTEAKIVRMQTEQNGDIAWERLSIEGAGWKDEWFTIVLSLPAILCFIPSLAPYIERGFEALSTCPGWYKWAFCVAVASSFGYKKLADLMSLRKGS